VCFLMATELFFRAMIPRTSRISPQKMQGYISLRLFHLISLSSRFTLTDLTVDKRRNTECNSWTDNTECRICRLLLLFQFFLICVSHLTNTLHWINNILTILAFLKINNVVKGTHVNCLKCKSNF